MAYDFLNTTTYSNDPLAQGDYSAFLPSQDNTPLGAGFNDTSYDSDLIEIVGANNDTETDASQQSSDISPVEEQDLPEDHDPQVDMDILNQMFQEEPKSVPRVKSYTPPPSNDDEEQEVTTPSPAPTKRGKVTPRIWQYGGKVTKYQVGGHLNAETYEQQRIGLNNPNYNTAEFNIKGTNTFRGLDNYQPVAITDGRKYQVLYGPKDTAKFSGKVYEKKMQFGGELKPETQEVKDFYNDYLNSANYKKRLTVQGHTDPNQVILDRIANIKGVTTMVDNTLGSMYDAPDYNVIYNPKDAKEFGFPMQSVLAHEYGHTIGASQGKYLSNSNLELNPNEMNAFVSRNKLAKVDTSGMTDQQKLDVQHDSHPSESKADLDALRFRLFKDKIYNTGTQDFTPELLQQAKEKYKGDNIVNRLFQNYSDDDLIYLMNHVAYNDTNNNRTIYG